MAWIQYGMRGDLVRDIQGILYQSGLYSGRIDGRFGYKTESALKQWQSELGLKPDGAWGPETMKATASLLSELNGPMSAGQVPVIPVYGERQQ